MLPVRFPTFLRKPPAATSPSTDDGRKPRDDGEHLHNTPAVVLDESVARFAELFGDPRVSAARSFLVSVGVGVIAIVQSVALYRLVPLKTVTPVLVEASPDDRLAVTREAKALRPEGRFIKAALVDWGRMMLVIDPFRTRDQLSKSTKVLRGKAVPEHKQWLDEQLVFRRMAETPTLTRTVEKVSADTSKDGIAFLFIKTAERSNQGEPKLEEWRFTIHYALTPSADEDEVIANPLGLNNTHYEWAKVSL